MSIRPPAGSGDTLLGLDFGKRRIGVAVGSTTSGQAQPLGSVRNHDNTIDWPALQNFITDWQPAMLVVGLPRSLDGQDTAMSEAARGFAEQVGSRFALPVTLVDEQLSSSEAHSHLREARRTGQRRKRVARADVDPMAATIILETWINEQNKTGATDRKPCN